MVIYFDTYFSLCYFKGCAGESLSSSVMLFDLGYFLKLGVGGSLTQEDFLGDQTLWHRHNFFELPQSASIQSLVKTPPLFPNPLTFL